MLTNLWNKTLGIALLIAGAAAWLFKRQAASAEREAEQQQRRADTAEARHAQFTRIDRARETLAHQHQEEKRHAQQQLESDSRDGLNNRW